MSKSIGPYELVAMLNDAFTIEHLESNEFEWRWMTHVKPDGLSALLGTLIATINSGLPPGQKVFVTPKGFVVSSADTTSGPQETDR